MCFYKFENKSARILHISVGEGQTLAIPPTEGGITIEVEDAAKPAFQANIATPAVQAWINDGQLTITEVEEAPPPPDGEGEGGITRKQDVLREDPPATSFEPPPDAPVEPPPEVPEHVRGRNKRSRDE